MQDHPAQGPAYDADALRKKYRAERDKRLRKDADAQYVEAAGDYAHFADDPYVAPGFARAGVSEDVDVLVVGGGFGGLLTAAKLCDRNIRSFRIVEQAGDFGGTWYWNRYPGVRCDIEAYIYMPLLEEVGTVPAEKYATGAEILAHAKAIGRHYGLYDHALFQTKLEKLEWDEAAARWIATTDRGDRIRARFVSVSQGPLAKVKLPRIPGIQSFKGRIFHSSRWDYDYTGGDASGGQVKLADKRVAIIGTGATAVQIVPRLAEHAKQLLVFQRTPSAIDVRDNRATDADWFKAQPKGWQRRRMENFLSIITGRPQAENMVGDHWTDLWLRMGALMADGKSPPPVAMQQADFEKMEQIRARVSGAVGDADTAETLKPWYNFLCKRPLFSDEYLPAFNRPNVTLVDTGGQGVEAVTQTGIRVGGTEYPVDCIIFATGFDVGAPAHKVGGYQVLGRGGRSIQDKWQGGLRCLHGTMFSGFPNFHVVGGAEQGTTAFNFTHTLDIQATHAAEIIRYGLSNGIAALEATPEAEERWLSVVEAKHVDHEHFYEECTPGFLNNEGAFKDRPTYVGGTYGGGPLEYEAVITAWRAERLAQDMDIRALDRAAE
ncbi:flavin-containing monooxygenase [Niveispirillum sp. KHB5.9]|uniref:flavin-containing monooxygenase n=1 Tax=Niveispirillum sp. KHB5.9 TaxID=3400269 RepID=UPI003A840BAF